MKNIFDEDLFDTLDLGLACCDLETLNVIVANQTFWNWVGITNHTSSLESCFSDFSVDSIRDKLNGLLSFSCLVYSLDRKLCFDINISKREHSGKFFYFIECFKRDSLPIEVIEESKVAKILAATDKTYFIVTKDCLIEEVYNLAVSPALDRDIIGKHIENVLHLSDKETDDLKFSIQLLENKLLDWDDFESLNDEQTTIGDNIYHVQFKQYGSPSKGELKLFVTLKDVTTEVWEAEQKEERHALQKMISGIMSEQESFVRFLGECDKIIHTMMQELEQENVSESQINTLFRAVHTIKGNAAAFDMSKVSKAAELAENFLRSLRTRIDQISEESLDELRDKVLDLIDTFNDTRNILAKSLGSVFKDWESGKVQIPKEKLLELANLVEEDPKLKKNEKLSAITRSFFYKPIKTLLHRYSNLLNKLAFQCDKKVHPLEISGGDILINTDIYSAFSESLVHVFRNAIDHGIEFPSDRIQSDKDELGKIKISIMQDLEYMSMIIEDDGGGIDPNIIRRIAKDRQLISVEEISQLSDEEVIDLIFAPGFSTAEEVTDVSGNGVGMDAVRTSVKDLGGQITVLSKMGQGTKFFIDLPL